jgi:hypothetical protein
MLRNGGALHYKFPPTPYKGPTIPAHTWRWCQYLHVQFEIKVEADKQAKAWIFYTDAIGNVLMFTHSYYQIPSAEYLTYFCHHAPLYSNNIYSLIRNTTNYIKQITQHYCLQQPIRVE